MRCARSGPTSATSSSMSAIRTSLLTQAPQETFLDPSHTYRLDLSTYRAGRKQPKGYLHPQAVVRGRRRRGQHDLCRARHGAGDAGILLDQPRQPRADLFRRRGRGDRRHRRHRHRRRPQPPVPGSRARLVAVVPGGRPAVAASRHRRDAGAAACRVFPGARRQLSRPVGAARQRAGDRALREPRLPPHSAVCGQAQEPDQREAVFGPDRALRRAQPLCPHHHRRGARGAASMPRSPTPRAASSACPMAAAPSIAAKACRN